MTYVGDVAALARKDLLLELRARDTLPAMLLFVAAVFVVFPTPFGPVTTRKPPRGRSRSIPRRTRFSPYRLPSLEAVSISRSGTVRAGASLFGVLRRAYARSSG